MNNKDIYSYNQKLNTVFNSDNIQAILLPAKISFFIQKNKLILNMNADLIEEMRKNVIIKYGIYNEADDSYNFTNESRNLANKELEELMNIDQDINFSKIKLSDLEGLEFTLEQMDALMFMIEED